MGAARTILTVEDFAKLPDDDLLHELDEGELLTMAPASDEHGSIGFELARVLGNFVKQHSLGRVYNSETGFRLGPDTVRAPDASFVRKDRLRQGHYRTFIPGPPDLAVEIFSPTDSVPQLMRKVHQYLKAGCHTVWIVYPEAKQVHIFEAAGSDRILNSGDTLEAPALLPGFSVPVASLFE